MLLGQLQEERKSSAGLKNLCLPPNRAREEIVRLLRQEDSMSYTTAYEEFTNKIRKGKKTRNVPRYRVSQRGRLPPTPTPAGQSTPDGPVLFRKTPNQDQKEPPKKSSGRG